MLCVQCGTDNPPGSKYCVSCNAKLFQAAPTGNPASSTLDIEEMVDYPIPETHYQSPVLQQLAWAIHDFIEEEGELEPVVEAYEAFREIFEGFKGEIPKLKELCYEQQGQLEDDVMPSQIKYMVTQSEQLYTAGETLFEGYFDAIEDYEARVDADEPDEEEDFEERGPEEDDEHDDEVDSELDEEEFDDDELEDEELEDEEPEEEPFPDPAPLVDGIRKWLQCNDCVCITYDFLVGRHKAFDELIEDLEEIGREHEARKARGEDGPIPDSESDDSEEETEDEAPSIIPSDSTDLA